MFERDRYGTAARTTLIADFVEACAWKYGRYQLDEIESLLRQLGRTRARDAFVFGPPEDDGLDDDFAGEPDSEGTSAVPTAADSLGEVSDEGQLRVIQMLRERQTTLGAQYPFDVDDVAVTWSGQQSTAYDSLLAITLAHAFHVEVTPALASVTVEVLFEMVTARCLQREGWRVHNMGDGGRHAGTFPAALDAASEALDWKLRTGTAPFKRRAQEEGCDTIIMVPWLDKRPGRLFLIGQAAVTTSEEWRKKISEPSPGVWSDRLQPKGNPPPIPFLAVSHHVEDGTLVDLQMRAHGIVVDRLRLACGSAAPNLTADEHRLIASVRAADVEV